MATTIAARRTAFRELHVAACFVMPNPWDVGSAIALQDMGFKALASTSAGFAWSIGRPDGGAGLEETLAHLSALNARLEVPLNADFENGFADAPEAVATNVARAVATGVAGLSIEDSTGDPIAPLYDLDLAVARIAAARAAIDAQDSQVVLTARSEGFIRGRPDLTETIRRLRAFSDAGADCLFAPGLADEAQIATVVAAVAPKPVNILTPGLPVETLSRLGARRISVGGALARVAFGAFLSAAREIAADGAFASFDQSARGGDLNRLFSGAP